jgi:glycosyltransferase involved in cell wall biosynthesis
MIDVVGHFGSLLSYATVSDQVVRGLKERDALGNVTNLDDRVLGPALPSPRQRGEKVILIADARDHLIEAMVAEYGRANVAIFMCPNTNKLSRDRDRACHSVGRIYTPSRWCADTILQTVWDDEPGPIGQVRVMPLGVDEPFATRWTHHARGKDADERVRMLHVTTDTFWDGRKGTEELLHAWMLASKLFDARRHATLTIHCLPQLYATIHQELGDLGLVDDVKLLRAPLRGSTPDELFDLIAAHDLLVAPSRSEGFGIMPLSALVSGTPVLTTADTGQGQYLAEKNDDGTLALGGWMQIATMGSGALEGEDGEAPMVRSDQLAFALAAGWSMYERELLRSVQRNKTGQADWSWKTRRVAWAESLIEWESRAA